jgi:hypothetical protein
MCLSHFIFTIFLIVGCDPKLPTSIQRDATVVMDLDDQKMWFQACEQKVILFQHIIPMVMENLTIV